ncbi:hypothetical protein [Caballeronia sp. BR00000012568055]|uniref:hypothetical protein n=1 Tax=Caballeronia sp. BR00000012568055 TaxID=2918761 RepID=UPI0023F61750|nr:hypothetical protein [Caballeronia sp. BR00000012568055]
MTTLQARQDEWQAESKAKQAQQASALKQAEEAKAAQQVEDKRKFDANVQAVSAGLQQPRSIDEAIAAYGAVNGW